MTRRRVITFLLYAFLSAVAIAREDKPAPTDELRLNTLVTHYNRYVAQLRAGIVDLKEWERVKKAWAGLE